MKAAVVAVLLAVAGLLIYSYWPAKEIQEEKAWTLEDFQRVYASWKYYDGQIQAMDLKGPSDPGDQPMRDAHERERAKLADAYNKAMAKVGYKSEWRVKGLPEHL